ncbi:MAG: SH3 domain-containing protein [Burkholderiaceae bacterium]
MKKLTAGVVLAAAMAVPAWAQAQAAYLTATVNLRAGPGQVYPVVVVLGRGLAIDVQGCLSDYSWCDVIAGPYRGWVYAGYINYPYQGAYVPVPDYGPVIGIGIGIISFSLGVYWHDHYRDRPWYHERDRWEHRSFDDHSGYYRRPPGDYRTDHSVPPGYRPAPPGYRPPRTDVRPDHVRPPQPVPGMQPPQYPQHREPPGRGQYRTAPDAPDARPQDRGYRPAPPTGPRGPEGARPMPPGHEGRGPERANPGQGRGPERASPEQGRGPERASPGPERGNPGAERGSPGFGNRGH